MANANCFKDVPVIYGAGAGVLDCVTDVTSCGVTVKNPHRFYAGQKVRVFRDFDTERGTVEIVKINEARKELTIASFDGRIVVPEFGDFLLADSK
jgi:hypothetical protein